MFDAEDIGGQREHDTFAIGELVVDTEGSISVDVTIIRQEQRWTTEKHPKPLLHTFATPLSHL
jgi:hypothetical protein